MVNRGLSFLANEEPIDEADNDNGLKVESEHHRFFLLTGRVLRRIFKGRPRPHEPFLVFDSKRKRSMMTFGFHGEVSFGSLVNFNSPIPCTPRNLSLGCRGIISSSTL
jgi:hypothetical protein